tara:strand:- start:2937 stop:4022 length:1086 start_codon:yes stop_codon:yes gene_type:complete
MKKTSLYEKHIENNAKMVPFAGFIMPVQYEGVNIEHIGVRNGVGIFDVSHMGEFFIDGENSLQMLNYLCTNNIEKLDIGKAQYNCMTNERGGIIDDLIIYKIDHNEYMLVVNASNIDKDWKWINHHNKKFKNKISNKSDETSLIAVQGPKSFNLLNEITGINTNTLNNYSFIRTSIAGCEDVILSTTGYTGSGGFEIYCKNNDAIKIWNKLFSLKNKFSLKPAGLASRDTLRIEMGYCLYGNDINEKINPIEAGLKWITCFEKDFIGKDLIESTFINQPIRKLVSFTLEKKGIPRKGYKIFNLKGHEIGYVTSGTMSPVLKKGIGLGYVDFDNSSIGLNIQIEIRNKMILSTIVKPPFVKT